MKSIGIIIMVLVCLVLVGSVSATYQAENPYNEIWYSDVPYEEKLATFNDYIGMEERVTLMEYQNSGMDISMDALNGNVEELHRLNLLYVDVCRGLEDISFLSDTDMYYLDSYNATGDFSGGDSVNDFIGSSMSAYCQWMKSASEIETDIVPSDAVFLPLPEKLTYTPDRSYVNSLPARERIVETVVEVPVIETIEIEKIVEVPVIETVTETVEVVKEVPVVEYQTRYVDVPVEKIVEVPIVETVVETVEVPVEVEKIVYKNFWDSVVDWWKGLEKKGY